MVTSVYIWVCQKRLHAVVKRKAFSGRWEAYIDSNPTGTQTAQRCTQEQQVTKQVWGQVRTVKLYPPPLTFTTIKLEKILFWGMRYVYKIGNMDQIFMREEVKTKENRGWDDNNELEKFKEDCVRDIGEKRKYWSENFQPITLVVEWGNVSDASNQCVHSSRNW